MKTKHTPGPWWVGESSYNEGQPLVNFEDGNICALDDISTDCADANARLIAAAPALLEAAHKYKEMVVKYMMQDMGFKELAKSLDPEILQNVKDEFKWINDLIAKAEGDL